MIAFPKFLLMVSMACSLMACEAPPEDVASSLIQIRASNGTSISAEVADEADERAQGLMFRTSLPQGQGMWFVFDAETPLSFWMKNTLIPLDAVFVDEDGVIVDIVMMEPCPQDAQRCPSYPSQAPARYVLEVNAGVAEQLGWSVGDQLEFPKPL